MIVGPAPYPTYWYAGLAGQVRQVVEVKTHGNTFYIDDEQGQGWRKVTEGKGHHSHPHASLRIERTLEL